MARPRYSKTELWDQIREVYGRGEKISAIVYKQYRHTVVALHETRPRYIIQYENTGRCKSVQLDKLYAIYEELYANGWIDRAYTEAHCQRLLGWKRVHAPGAVMRSILPLLDDNIQVQERKLVVEHGR